MKYNNNNKLFSNFIEIGFHYNSEMSVNDILERLKDLNEQIELTNKNRKNNIPNSVSTNKQNLKGSSLITNKINTLPSPLL